VIFVGHEWALPAGRQQPTIPSKLEVPMSNDAFDELEPATCEALAAVSGFGAEGIANISRGELSSHDGCVEKSLHRIEQDLIANGFHLKVRDPFHLLQKLKRRKASVRRQLRCIDTEIALMQTAVRRGL